MTPPGFLICGADTEGARRDSNATLSPDVGIRAGPARSPRDTDHVQAVGLGGVRAWNRRRKTLRGSCHRASRADVV